MTYTPVWGTGFEMGSKEIVPASDITGSVAIDTSIVHTGAYSLRLYGNVSDNGYFKIQLASDVAELYVSAWLYASADSDAQSRFLFVTTDGYFIELRNDTVYWDAYVNGSKVADGSVAAAGESWHLVEFHAIIGDSGTIQSKIDGVADIDYSGDTKPGTGTEITKVSFLQGGYIAHNPFCYIDDVTIATGDWIGDVRYGAALVPTADTAVKWWEPSTGTDNYALLDELPPSDTDYVSSGSPGSKDLYEMSDWTEVSSSTIQFLVDWIRARKGTAGDQQIRSIVKSGGTESSGGSIDLSITYRYYGRILATDPDTSAAWEDAGVDALQAGQEYL